MKKILLMSTLVYISISVHAQIKYTAKIEAGYHLFLSRPIKADAGEGWKGYELNNKPNGIDLNIVNGISLKNNFRIGVGVGYLNYEGINGYSIFGDLEYAGSGSKFAPLFNLKIGSSHINNQYENGSTSTFVDLSGGVEHKIGEKMSLQYKVGFRAVHQSIFLPIRIGARF